MLSRLRPTRCERGIFIIADCFMAATVAPIWPVDGWRLRGRVALPSTRVTPPKHYLMERLLTLTGVWLRLIPAQMAPIVYPSEHARLPSMALEVGSTPMWETCRE